MTGNNTVNYIIINGTLHCLPNDNISVSVLCALLALAQVIQLCTLFLVASSLLPPRSQRTGVRIAHIGCNAACFTCLQYTVLILIYNFNCLVTSSLFSTESLTYPSFDKSLFYLPCLFQHLSFTECKPMLLSPHTSFSLDTTVSLVLV